PCFARAHGPLISLPCRLAYRPYHPEITYRSARWPGMPFVYGYPVSLVYQCPRTGQPNDAGADHSGSFLCVTFHVFAYVMLPSLIVVSCWDFLVACPLFCRKYHSDKPTETPPSTDDNNTACWKNTPQLKCTSPHSRTISTATLPR